MEFWPCEDLNTYLSEMYRKDFLDWHEKKEQIDTDEKRVFFHEREIWWCSLGKNIGFEQDGKGERFSRPVVIFKKFNHQVFWAIPLSRTQKNGKHYASILLQDLSNRTAIISQLRLIDAKRLYQKIETLSENEYQKLTKGVISLCQ